MTAQNNGVGILGENTLHQTVFAIYKCRIGNENSVGDLLRLLISCQFNDKFCTRSEGVSTRGKILPGSKVLVLLHPVMPKARSLSTRVKYMS